MKKFFKVMLIGAAFFAVMGIGLTTAGTVMGAGDAWQIVRSRFQEFPFWDEDLEDLDDLWEKKDTVVQTALKNTAASSADNTAAGDSSESEIYRFELKDNMEIDLSSDELILEEQDAQEITVEVVNDSRGDVSIQEDGNTLEIESTHKGKVHRSVKVFYPKGMEFREVELSVGAGSVNMRSDFAADSLDISIGAGDFVNRGKITAAEVDLEAGTGMMTIFDLDAGQIDGECGIGTMEMEMAGKKADYDYTLECGIGTITIGEDEYSGLAREKEIRNPESGRYLSLECGIGEINVKFREE